MKSRFFSLILAFSMLCFAGISQAQQGETAHQVVQQSTTELLDMIVKNRQLYQQDNQKFFADIDGMLNDVVDMERIARRVMAKYYRQASDEQRQRFLTVFKQSLMNVYAKGLLEFDNQDVEVIPPRGAASDDKEKVDILVIGANGSEFPISYSMYRDDDGNWKMENVIVNGINIGLTYRNQFARLMQVNNDNMDKVIDSWVSEVKEES